MLRNIFRGTVKFFSKKGKFRAKKRSTMGVQKCGQPEKIIYLRRRRWCEG